MGLAPSLRDETSWHWLLCEVPAPIFSLVSDGFEAARAIAFDQTRLTN